MPTFPLKKGTNYFLPPEEPGIGVQSNMFETPTVEAPPIEEPTQFDIPQYSPDTRATDAFMELMKRVPQRDTPTVSRRVLAGLSTLGKGGMQTGEQILSGDYARKLADFNVEANLLKDMASAERASNTNERLLHSQIVRSDQADRRLEETSRASRAREDIARRGLQLRQFLADNPSYQIRVDEAGEFVAFNPKEPNKPPVKTGVKSGELSEIERLGITIGAADSRQEDSQAHALELQRLREEHERKMAALREELTRDRPDTPQEERVRLFMTANRVLNEDPEARRYITLGEPGSNDFKLERRRALTSSTQEVYDRKYNELGKKIYGNSFRPVIVTTSRSITPGTGGTKPPIRSTGANPDAGKQPVMTKQQKNTRTGEIRTVESTDGGKTWHLKK